MKKLNTFLQAISPHKPQENDQSRAVITRSIHPAPPPSSAFMLTHLGDQVNDLIEKSPSLHRDLVQLDGKGWVFKYGEKGQGGFTSKATKTIALDSKRNENPEHAVISLSRAVGYLAHEPRSKYSSLEDIVHCHMEQMGCGKINTIKVQREIVSNGGPDILGNTDGEKINWNQEYDNYLNSKKARNDREAIGKRLFGWDASPKSPDDYKDAYNTIVLGKLSHLNFPQRQAHEFFSTGLGDDVDELGKKSPSLVGDIFQLNKQKWRINYGKNGQGSHCAKGSKIIIIDRQDSPNVEAIVDTLAHEVGHALYKVPPALHSKKAFVQSRMLDEAAAILCAMNTRVEMVSNGERQIDLEKKYPDSFSNSRDVYLQHARLKRGEKLNTVLTAVAADIMPISKNPASGLMVKDYYSNQYDNIPKLIIFTDKIRHGFETKSAASSKNNSPSLER
jgi:hypothetical protein